ncbi:DUF1905 domain-containing protein [Patescibacteria group bacterium]|nr:DUF1905 domain-containing protein [Patescibacteria group bacterium]
MASNQFKFRSKVWLYPGMVGWHFVSLPQKQSQGLMRLFDGLTRGFGSLPVNVKIGKTNWKTSIFPDKKAGIYLLPLKKEVREKENFKYGDTITYYLRVLV